MKELGNNSFEEVIQIIETSRSNAYQKVNEELILMYQKIGKYLSARSQNASCLVRFECSLKFRMHRNASFGIPLFCLFLVDLVFSLTKMDSQAIKTPVTIPFCFLGLLCKKLTGHEPDNPQFGELNES